MSNISFISHEETRVLEQIVNWAEEYDLIKRRGVSSSMPTTDKCSKHFGYDHRKMLDLLNRLVEKNLIIKRRQLASGTTCAGYNGSLYSEVIPTELGREIVRAPDYDCIKCNNIS